MQVKEPKRNCKTVSAAVAYVDPGLGQKVMLLIHQAIYIPTMDHNLLCPMQLRLNDVKVNDIPRFLTEQPDDHTHALVLPKATGDHPLVVPLSLDGVTSYFPTSKPTEDEFQDSDLSMTLPQSYQIGTLLCPGMPSKRKRSV